MKRTKANEATAYHEAGHACAAFSLKRGVVEVSIVPEPESNKKGHVLLREQPKFDPEFNPNQNAIEREVIIDFAGGIAETKFKGGRYRIGSGKDIRGVIDVLIYLVGSQKTLQAYASFLYACAWDIVELEWPYIEAVANELLEHDTLSGRKARHIWKAARIALMKRGRRGKAVSQ